MVTGTASFAGIITLTVDDVGAVMSCSRRHVYRLIEQGLIPPPIRIGRLIRFDRATFEDWLKAGAPPVPRAGRSAR